MSVFPSCRRCLSLVTISPSPACVPPSPTPSPIPRCPQSHQNYLHSSSIFLFRPSTTLSTPPSLPSHSLLARVSPIATSVISSSSQPTRRSFSSLVSPSHSPYKSACVRPFSSSPSTMDMNHESSAKRKRNSVNASADRPAKHLKPENTTLTPGDGTPANGTVYDVGEGEDANCMLPVGAAQADSPEWQATIETVVKSVVSVHFCQTCSFDTDMSMSSQATGFVVDAERGYIMTNRHVVCAGPFSGYCIFDNHEEVGIDGGLHG